MTFDGMEDPSAERIRAEPRHLVCQTSGDGKAPSRVLLKAVRLLVPSVVARPIRAGRPEAVLAVAAE